MLLENANNYAFEKKKKKMIHLCILFTDQVYLFDLVQ